MSTPDQPSTPPLTRRQLRELRNTASNPIISTEEAEKAREDAAALQEPPSPHVEPEPVVEEPAAETVEEPTEPAAEEPAPAVEEPAADAAPAVDPPAPLAETPGVPVATRRQTRRSRVRPAPVVEAEEEPEEPSHDSVWAPPAADGRTPDAESDPTEPEAVEPEAVEPEAVEPEAVESDAVEPGVEAVEPEAEPDAVEPEPDAEAAPDAEVVEPEVEPAPVAVDPEPELDPEEEERAKGIAPDLGSHLLEVPRGDVELPASFDKLLARGSGSSSAPNALILSENPDTGSLSVPITATGELLITGSYALPDRFGSTGRAPGTADGKDVDASLIDGELPPASSPTPIAASSAISTIKSAEDIIRPPAPEKGGKLMMSLAITAGVLAVALAGVLILALVNGVF